MLPEPGEMHQRRERVERVVGADVRGRLLAADVLLARLQGEHEAAAAVDVARLADEAAGQTSHELGAHGHEAQAGAAVAHRIAERLRLADDDVRAERARRLQQAERDWVGDDDEQRARLVGEACRLAHVLERAEEVGLLHDHGGGVGVDRGPQGLAVGARSRREPDGDRPRAVRRRLGRQHLTVLRVHAVRHDDPAAPRLRPGQERGLGERRARVVHRGVGDLHAGELADRGLELEDALQDALTALGLVGRVGGLELGAADDRVDDRRHVVVVDAGAEEARPSRSPASCARPARAARRAAPPRSDPPAGRAAVAVVLLRGSRRTGPRRWRPRRPPASPRHRPWSEARSPCGGGQAWSRNALYASASMRPSSSSGALMRTRMSQPSP